MSGGRGIPFHCPYCGDENLRPSEEGHGAWECHACLRAFSLNALYDRAIAAGRLHGLVHDGQWFHVGEPRHLAVLAACLPPQHQSVSLG